MKQILLFALLIVFTSWNTNAQLTINVTAIPSNSPVGDDIYVAGNFNDWAEGNSDYILSNNGDNTFSITINPSPGTLEFKFTRGSWATVEGNENGSFQPNHTFNYNGTPSNVNVPILSWEDLGSTGGGPTTAAENVMIIDNNFYMPQLDRYRTIWVYLPPDYDSSNKDYPVIYMQDAQNLFDTYTSFSGEWEVDESMNTLFDFGDGGAIIVGINNGGADRIDEYTPWSNPTYGGGNADAYVDFIVETLKPFIDQNYRTNADRDHTGIMGSSLGGLVSMYAAIEHQEVFSKAGVFSPSFWFSDQVYSHVTNTGKQADMKIYLLASEQEDNGSVVDDIQTMYTTLLNAGFDASEVNVHIHQDGAHSEWFWAREFTDAYLWLCDEETTSTTDFAATKELDITIFPSVVKDVLKIDVKEENINATLQIHSVNGAKVMEQTITTGTSTVYAYSLTDGMYLLNVMDQNNIVYSEWIVVSK